MDKNSIIGFVLIALVMMGFFGYQSRQYKKQVAYQAQLDSIAAVERSVPTAPVPPTSGSIRKTPSQ